MPLFQPKIIDKALARQKIGIIPAGHLHILDEWKSNIDSGSLQKQTEVAIHAPFTHKIMVDVLGYKPFGGDAWTISREYGVAGGAVDLALGHFSDDKASDSVLAPFELKGAKTSNLDAIMAGRNKTPVQQAWDYARDIKGAQWVLLSNYVEIRLYAVSETSLVYEQFKLAELTEPTASDLMSQRRAWKHKCRGMQEAGSDRQAAISAGKTLSRRSCSRAASTWC